VIVARKPGKPPMPKMLDIDHEVIRALARLLDETGLTEIAIEQDGVSVRVARHTGTAAPPRGRTADPAVALPAPAVPPVEPR